MTVDDIASLQEAPPSTQLPAAARARYVTTKHAIANWEPAPMPTDWRPDDDTPQLRPRRRHATPQA